MSPRTREPQHEDTPSAVQLERALAASGLLDGQVTGLREYYVALARLLTVDFGPRPPHPPPRRAFRHARHTPPA